MVSFKNAKQIEALLSEGYEMKATIDGLVIEAQESVDFFIKKQMGLDEKIMRNAKINLIKAIDEQQQIHDLIVRLKSFKTVF